jgi:hypothetical protein
MWPGSPFVMRDGRTAVLPQPYGVTVLLGRPVSALTYSWLVFRRRTSVDQTAADPEDAGNQPAGKGRPTPTRREAEQARKQRVKPPLTRREALRKERELARSERGRTRQATRHAMATGDESGFLGRDKGPVRKFLRDYVDSRRTVAEFFLPIILLVLVTSFINSEQVRLFSTLLWVGSMLLVIVDLTVLGFRIKREVRKRFPDDTSRGHVLYAIARSTQIRKLRLPKPTVKPGTPV